MFTDGEFSEVKIVNYHCGVPMISNPSPLHPGKFLSEIYLSQMDLNQTALAKLCGC